MDAVRHVIGQIVKEAAEAYEGQTTLLDVRSFVSIFAMHRMITRLWQEHSIGVTEADAIINVGVSGPGVVKTSD